MASCTRALYLTVFLFLLFSSLKAIEKEPWLGEVYELEWRGRLGCQLYRQIQTDHSFKRYSSFDVLLSTSLGVTIQPEWAAELEAAFAHTKKGKAFDCIRLATRYRWLDDINGDDISLVTGLVLTQACKRSLHDPSLFHHGKDEAELFLSIGKETSVQGTWYSSWWGDIALGIADKGSPWTHSSFHYAFLVGEKQKLDLFADGLWGWGKERLSLHHFKGYGSIKHRSLDLGIRYTKEINFWGSVSLDYAFRVYACNFPNQTHLIQLSFFYPFGL